MDAAEGKGVKTVGRIKCRRFKFARRNVFPASQSAGAVEKKIAACLARRSQKTDIGVAAPVDVKHVAEVEVGEYVGIVDYERFVAVKPSSRRKYAAACVEETVAFVADINRDTEVVIGFDIVNNLSGKVMDVDNHLRDASAPEFVDYEAEHRCAPDFGEGFGMTVGKGFESCAESGSKNHGFHCQSLTVKFCSMFCSR